MNTGTLINDLMDTVERVEKRLTNEYPQPEKLNYWYAPARNESACCEPTLAGVA